jgi:NADH-quinone oxidoreductase subunit E
MLAATLASPLPVAEQQFIDQLIVRHEGRPGALLGLLERIQEHHPSRYLPSETLEYIAEKTEIPLAQIFSVVTFYALFNLEAQGEHVISICRGTACHTRGSRDLLERLKVLMSLTESEIGADKLTLTTRDRRFTLRTVACFGQCALAPVVEVDHSIFGHMNERTLEREVQALTPRGAK